MGFGVQDEFSIRRLERAFPLSPAPAFQSRREGRDAGQQDARIDGF